MDTDLARVRCHSHAPEVLQLVHASPLLFRVVGWDPRPRHHLERTVFLVVPAPQKCRGWHTVTHRPLLRGLLRMVCAGQGGASQAALHVLCMAAASPCAAGAVSSPLFCSLAHCPSAELI